MGKAIIPKGCLVHSIHLDGKGKADVGYRCGDEGGGKVYSQPGGGVGNYPHRLLRGITHVRFGDMTASGQARLGFTLIPRSVTCRREGREIVCETRKAR